MFSEMIKEALGREVVGQPHAINSVVRGVTRLASGMTPLERSWCSYLLVGPPGTGRTHLVRSLARTLYGEEAVLTVNCNAGGHLDPWMEFLHQLAPLFEEGPAPPMGAQPFGMPPGASPGVPTMHPPGWTPAGMPTPSSPEPHDAQRDSRPLRIVVVQDLEHARKELYPLLARALETGQISLPDGRRIRLNDCMFFFTSGLCTDQILDQSAGIGFSGAAREDDEEERGTLYKICREETENVFGLDLLAQFDNLIVFRKLEEDHLADVLDRHFARMSRWLERRSVTCELLPGAKKFLLGLASGERRLGTHDLIRAHRREVEFPVADLLVSGALEPHGCVSLDHVGNEGHLHLTVQTPDNARDDDAAVGEEALEIPVTA